jgi:hypothetical protein
VIVPLLASTAMIIAGGLIYSRWQRLQLRLASALDKRDFAGAILIAQSRPRLLRRNRALQHTVAFCRLLGGEKEAALEDLRRLGEAGVPASLLTLCRVLQSSDPHEALRRAREAARLAQEDVTCALLLCELLRQTGAKEPAVAELARAERLPGAPGAAGIPCARAMFALDAGDLALARGQMALAARLSPGDAAMLCSRAEIEIRAHAAGAGQALAEAKQAVAANRFALLDARIEQLERLHASMLSQCPPISVS